ncbi:MAG TPA: alpha/beta hydrolase [Solirubrobacteraceae bacterium]|nr:alpha/beta hydrolase [Solirubrobacteraceae bacterium]
MPAPATTTPAAPDPLASAAPATTEPAREPLAGVVPATTKPGAPAPFARGVLTLAGAALALAAALGLATAPALATPAFAPCPREPSFACATLTVPLDRALTVPPGTIPLAVERLQAGPTPSASAVLALAGGPGQAADPIAGELQKSIAPALHDRDLIVFDQRGTGRSDPLRCKALAYSKALAQATASTVGRFFEQCALQLGAARGAFTTQESVADIEAIREALGYEKLVLYGTSYGTKVAEEYAERYPQHVEALVLDSVVTPEGPEPFKLATFGALPSVLGELCAGGACAHITANPLADLARLAAQLRTHPLRGSVYDGAGHRHADTLSEPELLDILQAGDLNPALRALLPAAVQSALHGEPDPLLRLGLLAQSLIPNVPLGPHGSQAEREADEEEHNALFYATTCEEQPFPWQRAAPATTRRAEALAALHTLPSSDFYPFATATAWEDSGIPECLDWPSADPAPPAAGALPNVPALILSGAQDLRTPTANARAVAAKIPDAQLLVVPYTGHSVIGSDFGDCAELAVKTFFAGGAVQPCTPSTNPFSPTPITPTSLSAVQPVPGLAGRSGRTLTAVLDTLVDLERQVIGATLQAQENLPSGSSFGGLHGGYAQLSRSTVHLVNFTFVPGVQLSGNLLASNGKLHSIVFRVTGPAAAHGTVTISAGEHASGTLAGRRFDVSIAKARLSRAAAGSNPSALAAAWAAGAPGTLQTGFSQAEVARLR